MVHGDAHNKFIYHHTIPETKASPSIQDHQLVVKTSISSHIFINNIVVQYFQNTDQDFSKLSPEHHNHEKSL